jgi:hypothetical protein
VGRSTQVPPNDRHPHDRPVMAGNGIRHTGARISEMDSTHFARKVIIDVSGDIRHKEANTSHSLYSNDCYLNDLLSTVLISPTVGNISVQDETVNPLKPNDNCMYHLL